MRGVAMNVEAQTSHPPQPNLRRRRRPRVPVDARAHEDLFVLLTTLRAASAGSLHQLYFQKRSLPERTAMRRLHDLVAAGYLGNVRIEGARRVYHATAKALDLSPRTRACALSSHAVPPPDQQAMACWLRSALWASLDAAGWRVGRGGSELTVRRFLVDSTRIERAKTPSERLFLVENRLKHLRAAPELVPPIEDACSKCSFHGKPGPQLACPLCGGPTSQRVVERRHVCRTCGTEVPAPITTEHRDKKTGAACSGSVRETGVIPYDVAWRRRSEGYEVMIVLVDDPSRSVEAQVSQLPFVTFEQPPLPLLVRSTDPHSRFDRRAGKWVTVGRRRSELLAAFGDKRRPATLVERDPEIQAYYVR